MDIVSSDIALLERWRSKRDAEAFNEIVSRYGDLVYATCRRVLRNEADAQDVCQECFLRLAQTAPRIRASLPAWLHTTATRRSLDRIKAEVRRRNREHRFAQAFDLTVEPTWNDIETYVDEAIEELPGKYREVIVACFLERRTQEDVAQVLGIPRRTVGYRSEVGVERIRASLKKRGIAVSATTLGAIMAAELAEAAPVALMASLGKMALAGSATTNALAGATVVGGALTFTKVLATIVVVLAIAGAATVVKLHPFGEEETRQADTAAVADAPPPTTSANQTQADPSGPKISSAKPLFLAALDLWRWIRNLYAQTSAPAPLPNYEKATVRGHVIDKRGFPIAGAEVTIDRSNSVLSQQDGTFVFDKIYPRNILSVSAKKGELLSGPVGPFTLTSDGLNDVVITLYPPASIAGTVIDARGRPLEGVKVEARGWTENHASRIGSVEAPETNHQGQFLLTPLCPGQYLLSASMLDKRIRFDRKRDHIDVLPGVNITDVVFEVNLIKDLTISGHVRDAQGKPVADVNVSLFGPMLNGLIDSKNGDLSNHTKTTEDGAYEIGYLREGNYYVQVRSTEYVKQEQSEVPAGSKGIDFVLELPRTVSGQVVRSDTGTPLLTFEVGKMEASYDLETLQAMGYLSSSYFNFKTVYSINGRFEIEDCRGEVITVAAKGHGFAPATQMVSLPPKGAPAEEVVLRLDPIVSVRGVVRDTEGKPIAGVQIFLNVMPMKSSRDRGGVPRTNKDGVFTIKAIPKRAQTIYAAHPKYALGMTVVTPSSSGTQPVEIILQQGGRLEGTVTRDGEPLERAWLILVFEGGLEPGRILEQDELHTSTRSDGTYVFERAPENTTAVRCMSFPSRKYVRNDTKEVQVWNGETATLDFNLLSTGGVVDGVVAIDEPLPERVSVRITPESSSDETMMFTTFRGNYSHYELPDVPPGPVLIEVVGYFDGLPRSEPLTLATDSFMISEGEVIEKNYEIVGP